MDRVLRVGLGTVHLPQRYRGCAPGGKSGLGFLAAAAAAAVQWVHWWVVGVGIWGAGWWAQEGAVPEWIEKA